MNLFLMKKSEMHLGEESKRGFVEYHFFLIVSNCQHHFLACQLLEPNGSIIAYLKNSLNYNKMRDVIKKRVAYLFYSSAL